MSARSSQAPDFASWPDLALRTLGGSVAGASDELFAERENLIKPESPVFRAHSFGAKGQIYDGWETRRRRDPGHDWAIVRLAAPGVIAGVVVDTAHFTGNFPERCSVEASYVDGYPPVEELAGDSVEWVQIVPESPLEGDAANLFAVAEQSCFTHVRLNIFPDGGVARLRVHGQVVPDPRWLLDGPLDVAALLHGGLVVDCSNAFYSSPNNLLMPGRARVMGEGWETARRRGSGNDHVTVALAGEAVIEQVEVDTTHFKGNAPGSFCLRGGRAGERLERWVELVGMTPLAPDTRHLFRVANAAAITHARLDVYPDGGLARLRLRGRLTSSARAGLGVRWFDRLPASVAARMLEREAGLSDEALRQVISSRPLLDRCGLERALAGAAVGADAGARLRALLLG